MNRNKTRKIISLLLSFFLVIGILVMSALLLVQYSLLSPSFLMEQVDRSDYTENVKAELENTFISYGMSSGFEEDFFGGVLDAEEMRADIALEAEKLYEPDAQGADTEKFRTALLEKLRAYVRDHGEQIAPELDDALIYLADICTEAYQSEIAFPMQGTWSDILSGLESFRIFAAVAGAVFIVLIVVFLLSIHPGRRSGAVPYFIYALSASGLFLACGSMIALFSGRIERIGISGKPLYYLITNYLTHTVTPLLWSAVCMIVVSAVAAFIYTQIRRRECLISLAEQG